MVHRITHQKMCLNAQVIHNVHIGKCIRLAYTRSFHQYTVTCVIRVRIIILCMRDQIIMNGNRLLLFTHGIIYQFIN